jgi:DNA-binding MarR family transcriptional regulator
MDNQLIVLRTLAVALRTFKNFTGDPDVQIQCVQTFLEIAMGTSTLSMDNIARIINLEQSTASRNIKKLAVGPKAQPGYGLISIELDREDMRRRILKLTSRGHALVSAIEDATIPSLAHHFSSKAHKAIDKAANHDIEEVNGADPEEPRYDQ